MGGVFEIAEIDREADVFAAIHRFGYVAEERPLNAALDGDVLVDRQYRRT